MAQLSTTMSQAHRATAFHFFTSNLNRTIEQWRKSISCISDYNPTIPFLILPRNNARTTWLLRVAVNLHLAIGIYTKSESGSLSFHDFYLSQSVKVFQCKSSTTAMSFLRLLYIIVWLHWFLTAWIRFPCLKSICDLQGSPGCLILRCAPCLATATLPQSSLFNFEKRGTRLSLSCEAD